MIARNAGKRLEISPGVSGYVLASIDELPYEEALSATLAAVSTDYACETDGETIRVGPGDKIKRGKTSPGVQGIAPASTEAAVLRYPDVKRVEDLRHEASAIDGDEIASAVISGQVARPKDTIALGWGEPSFRIVAIGIFGVQLEDLATKKQFKLASR